MKGGGSSGYRSVLLSLAPFLVYAALTAWFCAPLLAQPQALGIEDWDPITFYHGAVLKSVLEYGQPPFWNPWHCGGTVLWQNPQVALLSPVYPLTLIVSLPLAMKIDVALHYFLSFVGMHLLMTRVFGLASFPIVVFLASLFTLCGSLALHLAAGHGTFVAFFWLPLLAFFLFRSLVEGRVVHALYAGALAALAIYEGGVHAVAMASVAFAFFGAAASAWRRDWRPLAMVAMFCAAAGLYAAPKLVPLAFFLSSDRVADTRVFQGSPERPSATIQLHAYVDPFQNRASRVPLQRYAWQEYGNYLGQLGAAAIVTALLWTIVARSRSRASWLVTSLAATTLFLFVLSLGDFAPWAPYTLLKRLPVFEGFRIPMRYTIPFTFFGAVLVAAVARTFEPKLMARRGVGIACGAVLALATCELGYRNRAHFAGVFTLAPLARGFEIGRHASTLTPDTKTKPRGDSPALRALMDDRTLVNCYEPLRVKPNVFQPRPLVFAGDGATVGDVTFGPRKIAFTASVTADRARIYLDQSYIRGWRSDVGPVEYDEQVRAPYVDLSRSATTPHWFYFVPPGLAAGLAAFVLGIALSAALRRTTLRPLE